MTNNDILRRLRYALDISDTKLVEIFSLGGVKLDVVEIKDRLKREEDEGYKVIKNKELNSFLNGFVIFKRGPLKLKEGEEAPKDEELTQNKNSNNNNIILRKLRVALEFRSTQMIKVMKLGGVTVSESELSALFRRKGHPNYRECGDKYIRCFLKGLTELYRKEN